MKNFSKHYQKRIAELKSENAHLKAEVERLTEAWVDKKMQEDRDALLAQVERLTAFTTRTIIPNEELQAQVERLTKTEQMQTERVISLEDCIKVLKQDRDGLLYEENEQVTRLKAEVERLTAFTTRTIIPNEELQAQVERLTKVGDELWEFAKLADTNAPKARRKALKDWNAAKEGKQS